jgi:hypothetical protein
LRGVVVLNVELIQRVYVVGNHLMAAGSSVKRLFIGISNQTLAEEILDAES